VWLIQVRSVYKRLDQVTSGYRLGRLGQVRPGFCRTVQVRKVVTSEVSIGQFLPVYDMLGQFRLG